MKQFSAFATGFNVISTGLMLWAGKRRETDRTVKKRKGDGGKDRQRKVFFSTIPFPLLTAKKLDSTGWLPKSV